MSTNYKFHNPDAAYFVSFAVVDWLDVFANDQYKKILLDSFHYCQKEKGMEIYAWCIMKDHVHLAFRRIGKLNPEQILGDFKRFTSKAIVDSIKKNPEETRRDHFLEIFRRSALKSSNVRDYQFWQHSNKPKELWDSKVTSQKIRYIHDNPVEAGYVSKPEDYKYSSAIDYMGGKGLLDDVIVVSI